MLAKGRKFFLQLTNRQRLEYKQHALDHLPTLCPFCLGEYRRNNKAIIQYCPGCEGKVLVAVSGYFNPLHVGHLRMIQAAAELGDRLVVIVNNDEQVKEKKSFPFMSENERLEVVRALKKVDEAILAIDGDRSVCQTLSLVKPHVFANGGDATPENCRELAVCEVLDIHPVFGVGGEEKAQSSSFLIARAHSGWGV